MGRSCRSPSCSNDTGQQGADTAASEAAGGASAVQSGAGLITRPEVGRRLTRPGRRVLPAALGGPLRLSTAHGCPSRAPGQGQPGLGGCGLSRPRTRFRGRAGWFWFLPPGRSLFRGILQSHRQCQPRPCGSDGDGTSCLSDLPVSWIDPLNPPSSPCCPGGNGDTGNVRSSPEATQLEVAEGREPW